MQYVLLGLLGATMGLAMRRITLWQRCGYIQASRRLYMTCAWLLGLGAYTAMLTQEAVLLFSGQLSWRNGLPLHLCSAMGLLTLPMLLTRHRSLWHISLYLGLPDALLALLFPAVLDTPWPRLTQLTFHTMHCCVFLAPLLPLSLGHRPSAKGFLPALLTLLLLACIAAGVNAATGGNYLFLTRSPIGWMNQWGTTAWRMLLTLCAMVVLFSEALLIHFLQQKSGRSH